MAKSAKNRSSARSQARVSEAKPLATGKRAKVAKLTFASSVLGHPTAKVAASAAAVKSNKADSATKQSRVLAMLRSPAGATIAAMMQATGWQRHSVRGFLAGVVRKRLKLNLTSKNVDGNRVYQVASVGESKAGSRQIKRRAA